MAKNYQRLCGLVRKAVNQYNMIQDGDRIAVGVSGGKDSVLLTLALADLKKYIGIDFEVVALTLDPRFFSKEMDTSSLEKLFAEKGIEYHIQKTDIGPIVFDIRKEPNPCSLCARLRRGALQNMALEHGCNKLALGHHLDDAIETFYMNLWNEGRIGTFSPVTMMSDRDITLLRPLCLATENEVIRAAKETEIPIIKSACPMDGRTNRARTKDFITDMVRNDPDFRQKSLGAFQKKDLDGWGIKGETRK